MDDNQNSNLSNTMVAQPSERKTAPRVTAQWEYDERRLEKETSEDSKQVFQPIGTLLNQFEDIANIAGGIASDMPGALGNLGSEVFGLQKEEEPKDPEEIKNQEDGRWIRQQGENLENQLEGVEIQKQQSSAKDANRISGEQMSLQNVMQEVFHNVTFSVDTPMTASVAYTGVGETMFAWKLQQDKIKATQNAQEEQEVAAASGKGIPGSLTNQNLATEGSGLLSVASGNAAG